MQRNVNWIASLILGHTWRREEVASLCFKYLQLNAGAWRFIAHESSGKAGSRQRRAQAAHRIPFIETDDFGRPTVIQRSSAPNAYEDDSPSRTSYDVRLEEHGGKLFSKAVEPNDVQNKAAIVDRNLAEGMLTAALRLPASAVGLGPYRDVPHDRPKTQNPHDSGHTRIPLSEALPAHAVPKPSGQASATGNLNYSARSRNPSAAAMRPSRSTPMALPQMGPASRDRMLTFRLSKASSLWEVEQLLSGHSTPPNMIHLAAAARQAVLLGSLPQPTDTKKLLDRHLLRLAEVSAVASRPVAGQASPQPDEENGLGALPGRVADVDMGPGHDLTRANRAGGDNAVRAAADDGSLRGWVNAAAGSAAEDNAGAGTGVSVVSTPVPRLREVGDVLWAYGKLQCKPPLRVWITILRPVLLDPTGWQQLREVMTTAFIVERKRGRQWRQGNTPDSSDAADAVGRELSKSAVALARMREMDTEVWRAMAQIVVSEVPDMSPRALASILWAFGSVRMIHGSLLAASIRAVQQNLRHFNSQDLVCIMWALSRLAPPMDGGASKSTAAAAAAARGLLYGDLSDAVRRCLQLRAVKPTELTTLLGVLDELAEHQQLSPRAQHLSPRLLRVVSQAVRNNLSSLPVGVLALSASGFQRLGHYDVALYRALASAMMLRLRHMEARHLLRAAAAMQAAGLNDRAFFAQMLEAAQSRLESFKRHEILAMVDVCSRLAGATVGGSSRSGIASGCGGDGSRTRTEARDASIATPASTSVVMVDPAVAQAFLHAAVHHAVTHSERVDGGSGRCAAAGAGQGPLSLGTSSDGRRPKLDDGRLAPQEPLRLRHWHRLLRTAAAAGWCNADLASRALDAVLQEVRRARPAWLTTVRTRAAQRIEAAAIVTDESPYAASSSSSSMPTRVSRPSSTVRGPEHEEDPEENDVGSVYDTVAGDMAGVVYTAALLRLRDRLDVLEVAVFGLLEALRTAEEVLATAPSRLQPQVTPGRHLRPRDIVALSPEALDHLQSGLDSFGPVLGTLESRRTRIAVYGLRQRLGLWDGEIAAGSGEQA